MGLRTPRTIYTNMTTAIASRLQSLIDTDTELVELHNADPYWQQRIDLAFKESNASIYLVFPSTTDTLAKIVKLANRERWRILICGNGSKLGWGRLADDIQLVVSTHKCDRLIEHAVGDLTVTIEAGMKLQELQKILRSHDQFLPLDPTHDNATLGGIVATADTGSWRQRYGGVRDLLLGLSFVRADGEIAKAGGRVVKNVAGYDLMKLFAGAYGTLGIITQLTFRTYPLIVSSQTLVLTGEAEAIALATQTIRNSGLTPTAMDLLSVAIVKSLNLGTGIGLIIRWQTIPESIAQQIEQVKAIAQQLNLHATTVEESKKDLWQQQAIADTKSALDTVAICKIGVSPTAIVNFLQLKQVIERDLTVRFHASSGIGQLQITNADSSIIEELRAYCQQNQGFLTILDAAKALKQQVDIWGYSGNAIETMQAIKDRFDPQNILNPNRFLI